MEPKASYWKFVAGFAAIILVALSAYFIWNRFFKYDINAVYKKAEAKYVAAMTADTYGGKTPQETLDLFVAALRKGDVELASKYFKLSTESNSNDYLTRLEPEQALLKIRNDKEKLEEVSNTISQSIPATDTTSWDKNDAFYVAYGVDGKIIANITLRFNTYSKVWKIESL